MAKKAKRGHGWIWFMAFSIVYAGVFLWFAKQGLDKFWDYMAAYEASRPEKPIQAYMEALTAEHIVELSSGVLDQVDLNIQSEEECRGILLEAVSGNISYARNLRACTETETVYMIMCDGKTVGSVTTAAQPADEFGFSVWEVSGESYDLSYLMVNETITVTAPHNYPVLVNGQTLDETYMIETGIQYEYLADYYADYQLPYIVTYQAGPFLGEVPEYEITDPEGNPVVIDESTDWNLFMENCTQEEVAELDDFASDFIHSYVNFSSSRLDRMAAYRDVISYIVDGTMLESRMYRALDGLQYNSLIRADITELLRIRCIKLEEGRYLYDVTYTVDTEHRLGYEATTVSNVKLIVVETSAGLQVESMTSY